MEGEQLGKTGNDAQAEAVRRFGSNDLAEGGGCRSAIVSHSFSLINTTSYTTKSSMIVNNSTELLASLVATFCMYAAVLVPRSKTHERGKNNIIIKSVREHQLLVIIWSFSTLLVSSRLCVHGNFHSPSGLSTKYLLPHVASTWKIHLQEEISA